MRVLFCMLGEPGHHLPTFPLASALRSRGHEVVYAAIRDLQRDIEARGFRYVPVYGDAYPFGKSAQLDRVPVQDRRAHLMTLRRQVMEEQVSGSFEETVRAVDPTIVLVDIIEFGVSFVVHGLGLPCLRLSTSLSQRLDSLPPITTSLPPDTSHFELVAARHQACGPPTKRALLALLSTFTARFAYPPSAVSLETTWVPDLTLYPEAVLCPEPFDFPRATGGPIYLAPSVELDRVEEIPEELQRFVAGDSPVLFASLGSQAGRYPHAPAFFRSVIGAIRSRPEWRLVIAAGEKFSEHECLSDPPANVLVLRRVPQLWLLRRSTIFVTHAGLGSVREALALHVPMIAVPQQFDQPGNASRVAFHGIGIHVPAESIDEERVERAIAAIVEGMEGYKQRLERLDEACRLGARDSRAVEIIEEAASRSTTPRAPARSPARQGVEPRSEERWGWVFVDALGRLPEGGSIPVGSAMTALSERDPELGVAGVTMCPSIGDALSRAVGTVLLRVQTCGPAVEDGPYLVARGLRCVWRLDLEPELVAYAEWCVNMLLEPERRSDPVTYAAYQDDLRRMRALALAGADAKQVESARQALAARAVALTFGGEAASLAHPLAHDAARFSRWNLVSRLAVAAAGPLAGTAEGAQRYIEERTAAVQRADAELLARAVARATAAGLDPEGDPELRPREGARPRP